MNSPSANPVPKADKGTEKTAPASGRLELGRILGELGQDGHIGPDELRMIAQLVSPRERAQTHALVLIANRDLKSASAPYKPLTIEFLTNWLAERAGLPYRRIDPLKIDVAAVTGVVSYAYATSRGLLPVAVTADAVTIATCEPYLTDWVDELSRLLRKRIERVVASPLDIQRYSGEFYTLARSVKRATQDASGAPSSLITNLESLVELGRKGQLDGNDHHIVTIVDWLLQYAFDQRASDIHLEPRRDKSDVRFRIDGVLQLVYQVPTPVIGAMIARIKSLGRMDVAEKRRPLDGRLKTRTPAGEEIELRLSTIPTAVGEKMVMRIFDPSVLVRGYAELGLSDDDLTRWNGMTGNPHGIVLVTGPTGSGKTTTLYSTLKQLARPDVNVCTIEDPIEMVETSFNQMQVHPAIDLTFANGVRALLRQDPDIIMIGEIRDLETAEMAVQAALTGHLVLSTLHTNDAASAVTRLLELGVPAYLINATLLGVMAQRLVRTLCPHCKEKGAVDENLWNSLIRPWTAPMPRSVYQPKGCLECRSTGYYGRIGLYEVMPISPALRAFIRPETDIGQLRAQAAREGMQTLRLAGARKVHAGLTTIEEVAVVAPPPEAL
jgi:general secretion pathway protein E